jgi:D-2-hydroxyacid dehydrogenase (NADP+)
VRRAVVDLASPRPVWRVPDATVAAVRRAFGRGWEVESVGAFASSDGDGAAGSAEALAAAEGALRWAHSAAAGVGASITPEFRATGAVLTNSRGIHAEPIADWVIAALGFCLRGFHAAVRAQAEGRWAKDVFTDGTVRPRELAGTRVGIVGFGGIGRAVARRSAALGMEVSAVRRHPGLTRPRPLRWIGGPAQLQELAGRRGGLLDEDALLAALDAGRLAGCALDVFAHEPLAADHPLWGHPRALVFPHVSAVSNRFWERETALLVENIARYRRGTRLKNVVNLDLGY